MFIKAALTEHFNKGYEKFVLAARKAIAQRISQYAQLVGRENVMAGADCGFSIHVGSGSVDRSVVWAKMAALSEGAKIASAEFWP